MKKTLVLFFILVCAISYGQNINQYDANGKRHGIWKKKFDDTKILRYQGKFKHGKEIETFKFYKNINNKPVLTATKTFNTINKLADVKFYSSTKHVISEGKMRGKIYVGKWLYYHKKSKKIMTEEYYNENGKLEGEKTTYYLSGTIAEKANYKAGKQDGETRMFSETGKLMSIYNYKNGELHGNAKINDANGNLKEEGVYKNDNRHGIWKFYKNGELVEEKDYTKRSKNPYKNKK